MNPHLTLCEPPPYIKAGSTPDNSHFSFLKDIKCIPFDSCIPLEHNLPDFFKFATFTVLVGVEYEFQALLGVSMIHHKSLHPNHGCIHQEAGLSSSLYVLFYKSYYFVRKYLLAFTMYKLGKFSEFVGNLLKNGAT